MPSKEVALLVDEIASINDQDSCAAFLGLECCNTDKCIAAYGLEECIVTLSKEIARRVRAAYEK